MKGNSVAKKLAGEVKEVATKMGASLVGIVSAKTADTLPRIWVGWKIREHTKMTTEVMLDAESIVVIGYHVWDDMLEIAIRKDEKWAYPGYFPLSYQEVAVIKHLEKKGHNACGFYSASCKKLAQLAGFGNYGKNALIINPVFGPWLRFATVLTKAEIAADEPFETDLCGECDNCVKSCPVGALTPYRVDDTKCLVGLHLTDGGKVQFSREIARYEPSFTKNSHLMCTECQKACKYGKERH